MNYAKKMSRLQIPYTKVTCPPHDFVEEKFNSLLSELIVKSGNTPHILEVFNNHIQYLAFIRDGQLYWASLHSPEGFRNISIKDFFISVKNTQFPRVVAYEACLVLFHSLLVCMQKEPELKVSSSLVDLEELLDKTESERKNALVTACHPNHVIMLRYKDSKPVACYTDYSFRASREDNPREEFLVTTYTRSARRPFEINLYSDLVVERAEDSRPIPSRYLDDITKFYLSEPPKLIVRLKDRPLKTYQFIGKKLTIGRLPENDIEIDNLSVSRKHAQISTSNQGYILKDLGSKNKTYLNGDQVEASRLKDGDVITIGKYQIIFKIPSPASNGAGRMDQTVMIPNFYSEEPALPSGGRGDGPEEPARLFQRSSQTEHLLDRSRVIIGKGKNADIRYTGFLSPKIEIEISRNKNDYTLKKIKGRKSVTINGEAMEEKMLEKEDLIAVGPEEFVFKH